LVSFVFISFASYHIVLSLFRFFFFSCCCI
jgi:hypothetical protein